MYSDDESKHLTFSSGNTLVLVATNSLDCNKRRDGKIEFGV
jgi:hypothetical protein